MNNIIIVNINLYDSNNYKFLLYDFVLSNDIDDFLIDQENKLDTNLQNLNYYKEFFKLTKKYFNFNYFYLISEDYNNITEDYDDLYDSDDYNNNGMDYMGGSDISDFECQVFGCKKYNHNCIKNTGVNSTINKLAEHIVLEKNFDIIIDELKYQIGITESKIDIRVRNENNLNFCASFQLKCHKLSYNIPTIFDFNKNKIIVFNTLNCVFEHQKKLAVLIPNVSNNSIVYSMCQLYKHTRIIEGNDYYELNIIDNLLKYINLLDNDSDFINNYKIDNKEFYIFSNKNKLDITCKSNDRTNDLHIYCQIGLCPINCLYLYKAQKYFNDIDILFS